MNKNAAKIRTSIRTLVSKQYEIISGTVISGSVDADALTMSVQPSDGGMPIDGVMLSTIINTDRGLVLFPSDDSNVVIGCIDGPGEWTLIKANKVDRVYIKLNSLTYEMDTEHISIQNGDTVLKLSDSLFMMKTGSENMFTFLKDLLTYIKALTVPTPSGTSGIPINSSDFDSLITRLDNLLTN